MECSAVGRGAAGKGAKKVDDGKIPDGDFFSVKALRSELHGGICL